MEILYQDHEVVVAVKPRGVLSEEKPDEQTMPRLLAAEVGKVWRVADGRLNEE